MLSEFVLDAAPGEAAAIARDIEVLVGANNAERQGIKDSLAKHSIDSLQVVKVDRHFTVLSKYNSKGNGEFWSRGKTFKAINGLASQIAQSEPLDAEGARLLEEVETYVANHYADAVADVFPWENGYAVVVVGEKLSPRNFFNGSFQSQYTVSGSGAIAGDIKVDVHYYEDGNVRLKAKHAVKASGGVANAIKDAENKFQQELTQELAQLNQNEFKALRRQLPVTRSQMVWSKASAGYKLGAELQTKQDK